MADSAQQDPAQQPLRPGPGRPAPPAPPQPAPPQPANPNEVRAPRGRHLLFGLGIVLAVALIAVGAVVGIRGYRASVGPEGAARGYFTALARGDAPTALAYGTVPGGQRTLLTSAVLQRQLRVAPIRRVTVGDVTQRGNTAQARIAYDLAFAGDPQHVSTTLKLHRANGDWRLDAVAVATQFQTDTAQDRVVGVGPVPADGISVFFPGALPLSMDTSLLRLSPQSDHAEIGAQPSINVVVEASAIGKTLARAAVTKALTQCLNGAGANTCPQPTERYVPGSLRGSVTSGSSSLGVSVNDAAGVLQVSGTVSVTGTYRRLTFANRAVAGRGTVRLPVAAKTYATTPLRVVWTQS